MTESATIPDQVQAVRLNIGGGKADRSPQPNGFINVDISEGRSAFPLEYGDESVDEIRASHILEHFPGAQIESVMREWVRVLKPGGRIRVAVPDIDYICQGILERKPGPWVGYMFGGQTDDHDYHYTGFNDAGLRELFRRCGLICIDKWESELQDCASLAVSLNIEGFKPTESVANAHLKRNIVSTMTMNRATFGDNMLCAASAMWSLGVTLSVQFGAFWGQCMQRTFEEHIDDGTEWLVTIDYDSVFTPDLFRRLCMYMDANPHVDAICPFQMKREGSELLVNCHPEDDGNINKELVRLQTAHFGLTIIRVEALKRMPKPWFMSVPNEKGEWGEGRTDDDIYFWRKWNECGNTVYLATDCGIGHLQQMVAWVGKDMKPRHQFINDFRKDGPLAGVYA